MSAFFLLFLNGSSHISSSKKILRTSLPCFFFTIGILMLFRTLDPYILFFCFLLSLHSLLLLVLSPFSFLLYFGFCHQASIFNSLLLMLYLCYLFQTDYKGLFLNICQVQFTPGWKSTKWTQRCVDLWNDLSFSLCTALSICHVVTTSDGRKKSKMGVSADLVCCH